MVEITETLPIPYTDRILFNMGLSMTIPLLEAGTYNSLV
jgi:hypothetical protein